MDSENISDNLREKILEVEEKGKKDFLKKTSKEKFESLYDDLEELEIKVDNIDECCYHCDDNEYWIEKIKIEQISMLERIQDLEHNVIVLEEEMKEVKKEMQKLKTEKKKTSQK